MKIAVVVQGRFHAFDLAAALVDRKHDVTVLTNYPQRPARRYGLGDSHVRSFTTHGILARAASLDPRLRHASEPGLHRSFGRWAARTLATEPWDIVHCWSGVSEELLQASDVSGLKLLMRGSAHILEQDHLLRDEEARTSTSLDRPSAWMCAREQREYALADHIVVLSSFAARTFAKWSIPISRVTSVPLGVNVRSFTPSRESFTRRRQRALDGEPLRVLFVGSVSLRKGWWDLAEALAQLHDAPVATTIVGPVAPEAVGLVERLPRNVTVVGKVAQRELPGFYERSDVFVFPTIEDGFGLVLAQAKAAGLPIITTDHSAGGDLIADGRDGWLIPIRSPQTLVSRLRWCTEHRAELAAMSEDVVQRFRPRDWSEVAGDFEALCDRLLTRGQVVLHA
jgi:glycosyltransferase involved in cell wall biosynthesis